VPFTYSQSDSQKKFPQVWVMAERAARALILESKQWVDQLEQAKRKAPAEKVEELQKMEKVINHWRSIDREARQWMKAAVEAGLSTTPSSEATAAVYSWLDKLGQDESSFVRRGVSGSVRFAVASAIQYAASDPAAAALIPPPYYNDFEERHLPVGARKEANKWQLQPRYHQMLGFAGSSQTARHVNSNEVMLLQLISDQGVNFMFCDAGEVEFWISPEDLAKRRFDRVFATTCGG
jgi:hypothetical protein